MCISSSRLGSFDLQLFVPTTWRNARMTKNFVKKQFLKAAVFFGGLTVLMSFSFLAQAESNSKFTTFQQASVQAITEQDVVEIPTETIIPEAHESFLEQKGKASWYGPGFHGRRTASGERYDMHDFTAAHRTLPFGTIVKVTNPANGKSALVRITDRGPFCGNRIIDLSYAAAQYLGVTVSKVQLEAFKTTAASAENETAQSVAFSPENDAVLIPFSEFAPVDSLSDFTDALREQDKLSEKMAGQKIFLAMQPKALKNAKAKYYVGVLKPTPVKTKLAAASIVQVSDFK